MKNYVEIARRYAQRVVDGEILACCWVKAACQRQLDDLKKDWQYKFDRKKANRICQFIEGLPHVEGEWAKRGEKLVLQPWQIFILTTVFGWVSKDTGLRRFRIAYNEMGRKNGKALGLDTQIPTPKGWTTMGDINIGDEVFGANGRPCKVIRISEIFADHECYKVSFSNGESVVADAGHLWKTSARVNTVGQRKCEKKRHGKPYLYTRIIGGRPYWYAKVFKKQVYLGSQKLMSLQDATKKFDELAAEDLKANPVGMDLLERIRTTKEIHDTQKYGFRSDRNHSVKMPEPIDCPEVNLDIDPYVLGVWLGDGNSANAIVTSGSQDVEYMASEIESCGYAVDRMRNRTAWSLLIRSQENDIFGNVVTVPKWDTRNFQGTLRRMGLLGDKHIPSEYLRSSKEQRLALLQGLMDTDGTVSKSGMVFEYVTIRQRLADGIAELLASMGIKFSCRAKPMRCNGKPVPGVAYTFQFNAFVDELPLFRLPRKLERMRNGSGVSVNARSKTVQITSIEQIESTPVRCIEVDASDGMYLFGRTMLPTHNSAMSAPIGIYMTCADGEMGAQVYSAATTRLQAQVVWGVNAKPMVERSPGLREAFGLQVSAHSIYQNSSGSFFKALAAEGNSLDGLNTHCAIIDELHAHQTDKVYNVIESSRGSRLQPLIWIITTAGFDQSKVGFLQRNYVTRILTGAVQDETYFGIIYTMDSGDDWQDESLWIKANPNLNVSVYAKEMRPEALKAAKMPSALNNFLTKRLCMWVNADVALFNLTKWNALAEPTIDIADFAIDPCWIGVDLAPRHDFCSRVALIRRGDDYYIFAKHFLSDGEIAESTNASYAGWAADGLIQTNPGETTDYDAIEEDLLGLAGTCSIQEVMYDPFTAKEILDHMTAQGLTMVEMRMSVQNLSAATKKLDALIADGRIHHNGDPILTYMLSNVVGHYDRKDNVYPTKGPDKKPIDGAIALIMALARAMIGPENRGSVYDNPEPIWLAEDA